MFALLASALIEFVLGHFALPLVRLVDIRKSNCPAAWCPWQGLRVLLSGAKDPSPQLSLLLQEHKARRLIETHLVFIGRVEDEVASILFRIAVWLPLAIWRPDPHRHSAKQLNLPHKQIGLRLSDCEGASRVFQDLTSQLFLFVGS